MSSTTAKPKFGAGAFKAWMRQGLSELRNALYPDSNVSRQIEPGTWGTQTMGEVADERRDSAKKDGLDQSMSRGSRDQTASSPTPEQARADPKAVDARSTERERMRHDTPAPTEPSNDHRGPPEPSEPDRD